MTDAQISPDLRTKLMLVIGGITALLMMLISIAILFTWRNLILSEQQHNAAAVTNAVSITISEVFINSEAESSQVEDVLERYVENFMRTLDGVEYIAIVGNDLRVIAHSDLSKYNLMLTDSLSVAASRTEKPVTITYDAPDKGWVLEAVHPLHVAGKRWGVLRIGFNANPTHREIQLMVFLLMGLTGLMTFVTLAVLYFTIGRLTNSLRRLVTLMDETDLETNTPIIIHERDDEVAFLLRHFDMLRQRLAQSKSDLVSIQQQIYQAEKLASIGRLASGVAHEINNPLNGIKSALYSIQKEPQNHTQTHEYLQLIDEGINYIHVVVNKLLGFARQQPTTIDDVNVNQLVNKVVWLLDYKLKQKNVTVQLDLDPELPLIQADSQLVSEVIMNLVLNSFDAIDNNGRIEVHTHGGSGKTISLRVVDNGTGIPEEHIKKIFDPFYTTKGPKEGTGLGLSVSLGIVETHGGSLRVRSTPSVETEFTVTLPINRNHENSPR
jgi:two-component system, NtrC family, sensor kinase